MAFCLPKIPSKKIPEMKPDKDKCKNKIIKQTEPAKTRAVPNHCLVMRLLPKKMTDARTVKNFLVVVMMEQGRGPKSLTHRKMKN